jgi:hypothetical protein
MFEYLLFVFLPYEKKPLYAVQIQGEMNNAHVSVNNGFIIIHKKREKNA